VNHLREKLSLLNIACIQRPVVSDRIVESRREIFVRSRAAARELCNSAFGVTETSVSACLQVAGGASNYAR
jgi:hypothetical protein